MASATPRFDRSVFINCPFDEEYSSLFETIIFTVLILNFTPRSAFEIDDGGDRLPKIVKIIGECKFGIHDISRTELDADNNLPRFNMPFELGLDLACKLFAPKRSIYQDKVYLVLDKEKHRFRIYLSDISGKDIKAHNNEAHALIRIIRDWLRCTVEHLTSTKSIVAEYDIFKTQISRICSNLSLDEDDLTFVDYCHLVRTWFDERKSTSS